MDSTPDDAPAGRMRPPAASLPAPTLPAAPAGGLTEEAAWRVASRTVFLIAGLILLAWLLYRLQAIVLQVLLAVILAAGMTPLVNRLAQRQWLGIGRLSWTPPRALVVLVLYLLLAAVVVLIGSLVIPPAAQDIEDLVRGLPEYVTRFVAWWESLPERFPFIPPLDLNQGIASQIQAGAAQLAGLLGQALVVFRVALTVVAGALNGIFILVIALYITVDSGRIQRYMVSFFPPGRRQQAHDVTERIGERLGGWIRGQILLSAIIGGMTLIGLLILDIRYAVLLALIAAIGEAIPVIGPVISAIPAVIVAFTQSPAQGFLTLGLYIIVQQLENNLIVPKVMERAVALHPLAVMIALLVGAELLGVTGAILSVPVTAALSVVVEEIRVERQQREDAARAPAVEPERPSGETVPVPPETAAA